MTIHDGTPTHRWYIPMHRIEHLCREGRAKRERQAQAAEQPMAIPVDVPHQECRHCKKSLPLTTEHFSRHPTTANGFDGRCKACKAKYDRKRWGKMRDAARV